MSWCASAMTAAQITISVRGCSVTATTAIHMIVGAVFRAQCACVTPIPQIFNAHKIGVPVNRVLEYCFGKELSTV